MTTQELKNEARKILNNKNYVVKLEISEHISSQDSNDLVDQAEGVLFNTVSEDDLHEAVKSAQSIHEDETTPYNCLTALVDIQMPVNCWETLSFTVMPKQ